MASSLVPPAIDSTAASAAPSSVAPDYLTKPGA
jgi:hypothetical protein